MAADDRPQITLITPSVLDLDSFPDQLAAVMDRVEIACLRLSLASRDEDLLGRAADACREVAHARDVAVVIENHALFVTRHGLSSDSRASVSSSCPSKMRRDRSLLGLK